MGELSGRVGHRREGRTPVTGTAAELGLSQNVLTALDAAVVATDRDSVIVSWNPAAERLFGYRIDEALGRSSIELAILPTDADTAAELAAHVFAGKPWEGSFPVVAKSGRTVLTRLTATPLRRPGAGEDGPIVGLVVLARDALRPEEDTQRAEMRLGLLSRAGRLLGTSLDVDRTIAGLGELLVPALADHCVIDLVGEGGQLVRLAVLHAAGIDSAASHWAEPGSVVSYAEQHPCARALRAHRTIHVQDVQKHDIEAAAPSRESAAFTRGVGLDQVVALPLLVRGEPRGVLSVSYSVSRRSYRPDDLSVLEELAGRAALALDNAIIHREQREVALTLQRTMLPGDFPHFDGLESAFRYRPGSSADVGGDWCDLVPLSAGRVGMVVGDVQGRGARAAAVMGQLRTAVRAYALLDHEPQSVLTYLDELVTGLSEEVLVTCVYGVYDPWTRRCQLARAGHPSPLLAAEDECSVVRLASGVPLGVGGVPYEQDEIAVPPGAQLVFYTDGVVERRGETLESGLNALRAAVAGAGSDPEQVCQAAMAAAGAPAHDDQALLVLRTAEAALPMVESAVHGDPAAVATARQQTVQTVREWGLGEHAELAELLVSELVTNAMLHGNADPSALVNLRLRKGERALWGEVHDSDLRLPRLRIADDTDEGGRGLYLVDTLAHRWGTRPTRSGKSVWFQLDL